MAQASEDSTGEFDIGLDDITPEQLAALAILTAVLTGGVFSLIGLQLDLSWYDAAVVITAFMLVALIAVVFAIMRAMIVSADVDDGNPMAAVTNPLFVVLFFLIALGVSVFVGVYTAF